VGVSLTEVLTKDNLKSYNAHNYTAMLTKPKDIQKNM